MRTDRLSMRKHHLMYVICVTPIYLWWRRYRLQACTSLLRPCRRLQAHAGQLSTTSSSYVEWVSQSAR